MTRAEQLAWLSKYDPKYNTYGKRAEMENSMLSDEDIDKKYNEVYAPWGELDTEENAATLDFARSFKPTGSDAMASNMVIKNAIRSYENARTPEERAKALEVMKTAQAKQREQQALQEEQARAKRKKLAEQSYGKISKDPKYLNEDGTVKVSPGEIESFMESYLKDNPDASHSAGKWAELFGEHYDNQLLDEENWNNTYNAAVEAGITDFENPLSLKTWAKGKGFTTITPAEVQAELAKEREAAEASGGEYSGPKNYEIPEKKTTPNGTEKPKEAGISLDEVINGGGSDESGNSSGGDGNGTPDGSGDGSGDGGNGSSADPTKDPRTKYQLKSIWAAYKDGDIDKSTAQYLAMDTIANFARDMAKGQAQLASIYFGGKPEAIEPSETLWDKRNKEMMKQGISSEAATVNGSDKAYERRAQKASIDSVELDNALKKYQQAPAKFFTDLSDDPRLSAQQKILLKQLAADAAGSDKNLEDYITGAVAADPKLLNELGSMVNNATGASGTLLSLLNKALSLIPGAGE